MPATHPSLGQQMWDTRGSVRKSDCSPGDALDMLTLASMLHRRLNNADVRQTVP
jgi:hypothetical protein